MHPRLEKLFVENTLIWTQDLKEIEYLTTHKISRGILIVHPEHTALFVDHKYLEACQYKETVPIYHEGEIDSFIKQIKCQKVLFDGKKLTYDAFERLKKLFPRKKLISENPINHLRLVKEDEEIEKMRRSAHLNRLGYEHIRSILREGITEKEVAWEYEKFCREKGADELSFSPIIAFGHHTSMPHYKTGERILTSADAVLIDIGVTIQGYMSDFSRSFYFEGDDPTYNRYHNIVLEAYAYALTLCRPGTQVAEIDQKIRLFLDEYQVRDLFKHNSGHSLGLEIHEYPTISSTADPELLLEENMVITIEPGLYLEGQFGIRHEDTIVITKTGYSNFYQGVV